jgi:MarR family transcriptional regulator, 2-MHQ and catechol-resistance regulon repressor
MAGVSDQQTAARGAASSAERRPSADPGERRGAITADRRAAAGRGDAAAAGGAVAGPPELDDERLTVMGLLAEAFTGLAARGAAQLGGHGVSPVEFEVLLRLARSPLGLLRMTDLTAQTDLTNSGITRVVDRLSDRGLVARQACDTDRRTTYAVVTDSGRALLAEILPSHLELIETWLLQPLRAQGEEELAAFLRALRRVRDHVVPCATAGSAGPELPPHGSAGR